ncbi:alpha/beta hydrolase [Psychroserpens sp.]|uniref:alpha/beta hydrolase n=1 Tax=Psychroserpens sp. TaxID=2020870 RepID=UPI001B2CA9D8|nr:alpha/beta fold hydrolase [Psychroserpens sp.]MBO6606062.1 alpha/beta fold hydrolase [Psychroserpens sp.]MBO6630350.1 alpha/beta fold hydrolase [Psychroserpens sp.]MBO6652567.1 alpha/beta fold hydrolase [Psychroserpens sp.]MBO6681661.1 alpha/beta fold hydrolase [Psychroserpens sp.]MBO6749436.1 alpha/beta fold hydrolase [Psychroserpens sp.]
MKDLLCCFAFLCCLAIPAQNEKYASQDIAINKHIDGTLLTPVSSEDSELAIIIAGSGPTDRNGNQNFMQNNALKKLAESLSEAGIATFRYDKRIVKQIRMNNVDPNMTFDDFIDDAISVVDYFKNDGTYTKVYVIGHSQGSLVGMLATKDRADGFISLAGAGQTIDGVIIDQVGTMDPSLVEPTKKAFTQMKEGQTVLDYPQALTSIFRADLQPFIRNWMQYDPQSLLKELEVPTLIVNGTKDLQVSVDEAKRLKSASQSAELVLIENMNHVLFIIEGGQLENSKSYNEAFRNISEELVTSITTFIKD